MSKNRLSPAERVLRAKHASHVRWKNTPSAEASEQARERDTTRFEKEVDPEGILEPRERARRAEHARSAYYTKLAYASLRARRAGPPAAA
jgi:hypothetical protein